MTQEQKFDAMCKELYDYIHGKPTAKITSNSKLYNWILQQRKNKKLGRLAYYREQKLKSIIHNIFDAPIQEAIEEELNRELLNDINEAIRELLYHKCNGIQDIIKIYKDRLYGYQLSKRKWEYIILAIKRNEDNSKLFILLNKGIELAYKCACNNITNGSMLLAKDLVEDDEQMRNVAYNLDRFQNMLRSYLGESRYNIIYKKYYEGYSYSDIARQLNVSRALISFKAKQSIEQLKSAMVIKALDGENLSLLPAAFFGQKRLNRILSTTNDYLVKNILGIIKKAYRVEYMTDEYILGRLYAGMNIECKELDNIIAEVRNENAQLALGYDSIFNQGINTRNIQGIERLEQEFILRVSLLSCKYNTNLDICILRLPISIEKRLRMASINTVNKLIDYVEKHKDESNNALHDCLTYINKKVLGRYISGNSIYDLNISDTLYNKLEEHGILTINRLKEVIETGEIYDIKGVGKSKAKILKDALLQFNASKNN